MKELSHREELAAKKKAWEDAENAASEARKLAENKAQEAANQKSLYQAVMETHNTLEAALEKLQLYNRQERSVHSVFNKTEVIC